MSDRIAELVLDGCAFVACPRPQDCDTCPLTELATTARENRTLANQAAWNKVEADKWRKVAERLANEAACHGISCFHNHPDDHEQTGSCEEAEDRDSCAAYRLAAALAAVEQEEAE